MVFWAWCAQYQLLLQQLEGGLHLVSPHWDSHDPPAPAHGWGYCQRSESNCRYKSPLKIAFSAKRLACRLRLRALSDALLQALRCNRRLVSQPPCTSLWRQYQSRVTHLLLTALYIIMHNCHVMTACQNHKVKINIPAPDGPGSIPFT